MCAAPDAIRPDEVLRPGFGTSGLVLGGKYRLDAPLAQGGMARVWRATHVTLNRPVAVKFIDALGSTAAERAERFLREAQVAASVRHQNVVDILDFGLVSSGGEDEPYMVMELLEGLSLDERLATSALDAEGAVEIAVQVLAGLEAVHRAGIVHCDLKPGNVFLTDGEDGVFARLLDFGISKGTTDDRDCGIINGTPEYMSPEQAYGGPLDARSDLYSVGVVLYEMLAAQTPFTSPDPAVVVARVAAGPAPSLSLLRPDLPELCAVVDRAMAHDRGGRFDSALAMRRALLGLRATTDAEPRTGGTPERPVSGTRVRPPEVAAPLPMAELVRAAGLPSALGRRGAIALVLGLLAVVGGAAWTATRPGSEPSVVVPHAVAPRAEPPEALLVVEPVAVERIAVEPAAVEPAIEAPSEDAVSTPEPGVESEDAPARVRGRPRPESGPRRAIVREADF